jgi:hypothetical protein
MKKAKEFKKRLINNCSELSENDVKITSEIKSYYPNTNRNASLGKTCPFVFVDLQKLSEIDKENPDYQKIKDIHSIVESMLKSFENEKNGIEYYGKPSENKGYTTTKPHKVRYNLAVDLKND